jgi:hypothetical protein
MLLVSTKLGVSLIEGIGLFAVEPITAGTVIWRLHPIIDLRLTDEQLATLAPPCREQAQKYSYREKHSGLYVLCGDDARFFNHSDNPNCLDIYNGHDEDLTVAVRDIKADEELTCDYAMFDLDLVEGNYHI